jgi:hypothetical protein
MENNEGVKISINLRNNNEIEQGTKIMLERILDQYELDKYIRCNEVIIEKGASGKAFPIIRLSAWKSGSEESLLAQFVHEQFHWIEKGKEGQMIQAVGELKTLFPDAPIAKPEGGGSEKSTYCHLIICRLELLALTKILSEEKALSIVSGNTNYTWIRKIVIERGQEIDQIIKKYFSEALEF